MVKIFSIEDRKSTLDYILSTAKDCPKIVSLVQVGSGAEGFHDEKSDLDFVIAYDNNESMTEVMDYMHNKISENYNLIFYTQSEEKHLQVYVLDNFLEIDIGFGCYEHAAALKPAFKVLFDNSGTVEDKMIQSRTTMDERIYGSKQKKDLETARNYAWTHLMHAAVAIKRNNYFRTVGELEFVRDYEKEAIKSTYITDDSRETLWACLINLTDLIYKELEGSSMPISKEMLVEYYNDLK